jgi:phenylalanyl-tRNA synthetase beta chain
MKFTFSWLKEHLETDADLSTVVKTLTAIGLEVEEVIDPSESLKDFTVAKIISAEKHPDADKLQVCSVESDVGNLQIVCGAPNARAGLFVALAKEGTTIPGAGFTIKKTKIRGVESNGMLCSASELGMEGDDSGILELPEAPIGSAVATTLGLNDPVIDIAITPNRADCLGVHGIARDLAAAGLGTLKTAPKISPSTSHQSPITVTIATPHCSQFIGCHITGVTNGESPDWLKQKLAAIGAKSISTLVDITNYFTFTYARPLHVYDAKKLNGNITVREAKDGETITTLDDKEYALKQGMCVIADDNAPVAIGGVIGGVDSGVSTDTTELFLEVALFTPEHVATTGRELQIESDARYRFERGIDVAWVEEGAKRAIAMILELCGGQASELVVAGSTPEYKRKIAFDPKRIKTLGGVDVPQEKIDSIIESLGLLTPDPQHLTPPSWRSDVEGEADIVEEVLRIHGYDTLIETPLPKPSIVTLHEPTRTDRIKQQLVSRGYLEVRSYSFIPHAHAIHFGGGMESLQLANPISEELADMRPNLLPNLLAAAAKNHARGSSNLRLAEVGLTYHDTTENGQQLVATGMSTGEHTTHRIDGTIFNTHHHKVSALDAKADALAMLAALGMNNCEITADAPSWYHPGRSGSLRLGKKILLGHFGELHPATLAKHDIETTACAFELFIDNIPAPRAKGKARPALVISDYQAVTRDFAFVVDDAVRAADIERAISSAEKKLLKDVLIFDVYAGKGVEDGKKSVAVQITLQAADRTLADDDIKAVADAVVSSVTKNTGGVLRA